MPVPVERDHIPLHIVCNTLTIERNGKFLIIRRRPDEVAFPGKWEFVGGKLENGEGIKASLRREAKEETGLEIEGEPIFTGEYEFTRRDGHHVVGLRFVARAKEGDVFLSDEHTECAWITPAEAPKYDLIKGLDKELREADRILKRK
ncbi:ADP-ribose pyrophosphatase [uncultured archaeon]|nr:ADP-ribose pyrophosphatase [uncultured archaeon]